MVTFSSFATPAAGRGVCTSPASHPITSCSRAQYIFTVLKLLSNCHYSPPSDAHEVSPSLDDAHASDGESSSSSTSDHTLERTPVPARTVCALMHIDVLAANGDSSPHSTLPLTFLVSHNLQSNGGELEYSNSKDKQRRPIVYLTPKNAIS